MNRRLSNGKAYKGQRIRYTHISAYAKMVTNPKNLQGPLIPWIEHPGVTLVLHRKPRGRHEVATGRL